MSQSPFRPRPLSWRSSLVVAPLCLLAACASGRYTAPEPTTVPNTVRIEGGGAANVAMLQTFRDDRREVAAIAAAPDAVFQALRVAFINIGLEANTIVPPQRTVGVTDGRVRRALGKERLSRYLSCGENVTGMADADLYDVRLNVTSSVQPGEGEAGSMLQTIVTADARPVTTSGSPVQCASTGNLEGRIVEEVRKLVAR